MQYLTIDNLKLALEALGTISAACSVLSHLPGKVGAVFGEIGVDIAGFVAELKK
jgi:hypothetical protein